MWMEPVSSTRLRHIGRTLRKIREDRGKTLSAVRRHLDRSPASLSTIENGLQPLRPRDLKYILYEYGVAEPLFGDLVTLAEQQRHKGWWLGFKDVLPPSALDYASLENDAAAIDIAEMAFIPGLFQTADYTRAIMQSGLPEHQLAQAERYVAFRMARQRIIRKPDPPRLRLIIDEAALHRTRGGPEVMRAQLIRLIEESQRDHVALRVLPFSSVADPGLVVPFQLLDIGDPAILSAVFTDHLTGLWIVEDDAAVRRYRERFECGWSVALPETGSRELIHQIISEL
ncbi:MAG TPA: helix-turn-helix transcriptional regulator [Streptosporangiaceae bacterium]